MGILSNQSKTYPKEKINSTLDEVPPPAAATVPFDVDLIHWGESQPPEIMPTAYVTFIITLIHSSIGWTHCTDTGVQNLSLRSQRQVYLEINLCLFFSFPFIGRDGIAPVSQYNIYWRLQAD